MKSRGSMVSPHSRGAKKTDPLQHGTAGGGGRRGGFAPVSKMRFRRANMYLGEHVRPGLRPFPECVCGAASPLIAIRLGRSLVEDSKCRVCAPNLLRCLTRAHTLPQGPARGFSLCYCDPPLHAGGTRTCAQPRKGRSCMCSEFLLRLLLPAASFGLCLSSSLPGDVCFQPF